MSATFTYGARSADQAAADAVIRFIGKEELSKREGAANPIVQPQIDEAIRGLHAKGLFKAEAEQTEIIPTLGLYPAPHIVFAGFDAEGGATGLRLAAASAANAAKKLKAAVIQVLLPDSLLEAAAAIGVERAAAALTEGMLLALHTRQSLKREPSERFALRDVAFVPQGAAGAASDAALWERGIASGKLRAEGVGYARDLTNLPGNDLTPERLAFHAEELAREHDLEIEVIDEWSAADQRMGGLLAVGQGSINPPRMIVIHYKGDENSDEAWGLIGKGITFDTGGISLKRAAGMEEMISDMGGAAAVLGAIRVIAELKPSVNVIAVVPTAENMPSDRAFKPGDVLRMMSGHTVEIVNTDAEGRLVLADGLTTAITRGATKLVDVATLTGNVMAALGAEATGAVTNDEGLLGQVLSASERAGERIWQLPAYPEFKKQLRSGAADLKNGGGRYAGAITGGLFIGHFAEGLPWVHLDIGGTAWLESGRGWEPKGATGVMVRTLVELIVRDKQG
ncbi:leucyl aminopeptidase [Paenibacillus arenilitoris]|uniref:Probable cytosol aminopeptidase n=1 Tax=Paenibacillus arenilitoris TaxID=2772299 RepID=A0A927H4N3_9BACL|nr:leucyl aminopeptidase [Paenibacillus arenilitoris]MBD2867678.1 leucyl aminopeptidase [Paenibacillus arenilitoris]